MKRNILKVGILAVALSASVSAASVDFGAYMKAAQAKMPAAMGLFKKYSADFKAGVSLEDMMRDAMETVPGQLLGVDLKSLMTASEAQAIAQMGTIESNLPNAIAGIGFALDSGQLPVIANSAGLLVSMLKDWGVLPSQLNAFAAQAVNIIGNNAALVNSIGTAVHGLLSQVKDALENIKGGLASKGTAAEKATFLKTQALPYLFNSVVKPYFDQNLKQYITGANAQKLMPLVNTAKGINWGSIDLNTIKAAIMNKVQSLGISF